MLISPDFDRFFANTIRALRSYLDNLVCIGGCANALYRHHPKASRSDINPIVTMDIDLASEPSLPVMERPIADIMSDLGMTEDLRGHGATPVSRYLLKNSSFEGEIEFLCPLLTGRHGRGQYSRSAAVPIQDNLTAQPLDYLQVLLFNPWTVDLGSVPVFHNLQGINVRIPNPVSYVVQKALIRDKRRDWRDKAKDSFYIFEISTLFRDYFDALAKEYEIISRNHPATWLKRFHKIITKMFTDEHSPGATEACGVYHYFHNSANTEALDAVRVSRSVNNMLRFFQ